MGGGGPGTERKTHSFTPTHRVMRRSDNNLERTDQNQPTGTKDDSRAGILNWLNAVEPVLVVLVDAERVNKEP